MTERFNSLFVFLIFLVITTMTGMANTKLSPKKEAQLNEDLSKIWPFVQTVKVEYELVMAQLETIECDSAKKEFLFNYEKYVKDAYFDKVVRLNVRQGKLLLLLIDRELGRTPYDLLVQFLNQVRADFWQKMALILDADLKGKYYAFLHPEMEEIILRLSRESKEEYLLPK
jgi:hypothetical protein